MTLWAASVGGPSSWREGATVFAGGAGRRAAAPACRRAAAFNVITRPVSVPVPPQEIFPSFTAIGDGYHAAARRRARRWCDAGIGWTSPGGGSPGRRLSIGPGGGAGSAAWPAGACGDRRRDVGPCAYAGTAPQAEHGKGEAAHGGRRRWHNRLPFNGICRSTIANGRPPLNRRPGGRRQALDRISTIELRSPKLLARSDGPPSS